MERDLESGHPEGAPVAGLGLGVLRFKEGDLTGSLAALRVSTDAAEPGGLRVGSPGDG
jgi:hypothetical protein